MNPITWQTVKGSAIADAALLKNMGEVRTTMLDPLQDSINKIAKQSLARDAQNWKTDRDIRTQDFASKIVGQAQSPDDVNRLLAQGQAESAELGGIDVDKLRPQLMNNLKARQDNAAYQYGEQQKDAKNKAYQLYRTTLQQTGDQKMAVAAARKADNLDDASFISLQEGFTNEFKRLSTPSREDQFRNNKLARNAEAAINKEILTYDSQTAKLQNVYDRETGISPFVSKNLDSRMEQGESFLTQIGNRFQDPNIAMRLINMDVTSREEAMVYIEKLVPKLQSNNVGLSKRDAQIAIMASLDDTVGSGQFIGKGQSLNEKTFLKALATNIAGIRRGEDTRKKITQHKLQRESYIQQLNTTAADFIDQNNRAAEYKALTGTEYDPGPANAAFNKVRLVFDEPIAKNLPPVDQQSANDSMMSNHEPTTKDVVAALTKPANQVQAKSSKIMQQLTQPGPGQILDLRGVTELNTALKTGLGNASTAAGQASLFKKMLLNAATTKGKNIVKTMTPDKLLEILQQIGKSYDTAGGAKQFQFN